jgi:hypothetical protein
VRDPADLGARNLCGGLLLAGSFVAIRHSLTRGSRLYRMRSSILPASAR